MTKQLKAIRTARGLSQADIAAALGIATENYNKLENGKTELTYSRMKQLADILHVDPVDLISEHQGTRTVRVRAFVEAGMWEEAHEWAEDDWYEVSVPDAPDLRPYQLYGVETRGPSMDKVYPEGTVVVFTSMIERPSQLEVGKKYIIERERADGMREATVKTLARDDTGKYWLLPESNDPRFQKPIEIDGIEGDLIKIIGKVVYSVRRED